MATAEAEVSLPAQIGQRIRVLRKTRSWSQERLSRKAGVSKETIRRYELGLRVPALEHLGAVAAALEVDWSGLLPTPDLAARALMR